MDRIVDHDFFKMVEEIKQMIKSAQYRALQTVNTEQISLYWSIGKTIVERQQVHGWGNGVVERLSDELQQSFPNTKGFSAQNLWYMRQFFTEYHDSHGGWRN